MDEKHLHFYVGEITPGGTNGTKAENINMACYATEINYAGFVLLRFALRCDDGYEANNVKIYLKWYTSKNIYWKYQDYSNSSYTQYISTNGSSYFDFGKVENKNKVMLISFYDFQNFLDNIDNPAYNNFKIEVSYDIAQIGVS